jgi:hypothetical protein
MMAKFRLLTAHQLRNSDLKADVLVLGDRETEHLGEERGTLVGDGTQYPVVHATLEMLPLDEAAELMLNTERDRLARNHASMNPVDQLPMQIIGSRDDYDDRYIPGFHGTLRPDRGSRLVEDKS